MYAVTFDLKIDELKISYGEKYHSAYSVINKELKNFNFIRAHENFYINYASAEDGGLVDVYELITRLIELDWFVNSVKAISVFKIDDWSDFTPVIKEKIVTS